MLNKLLIEIENNKIIVSALFQNYDEEELLDMRDSEEFDGS